ncbi:hypothetical protein AAFL31_16315 [Klebsiella huaxiensis]|uniref:hypothetical protein n=1 Tax=Klebsiella huaxiensis TaxID=2153354 RepID=UPI003165A49B
MNGEKFNPQDIEEILSRPPSSDSHKVKKGDIPEIAKSIGIGAIEIAKALPALAFGAFSLSSKQKHNPRGYRFGDRGYGYYDEMDRLDEEENKHQ